MSNEAQEALELIATVRPSLPWRFDEVTQPEKWKGTEVKFGAIRTSNGQNVIQPFEGSSSVMMGIDFMVNFLINAPKLIQALADEVKAKDEEIIQLKAENAVLERLAGAKKD